MPQRQQFLNFDKPEFVNDFVYTPPFEAMDRALKVRQGRIDTDVATADMFNSLNFDYIDDDDQRKRVQEIVEGYAGKAKDIATAIQADPLNANKYSGLLNSLKNTLAQDFTHGEIYKTIKNAKNFEKAKTELAKMKDPTTRYALEKEAIQKWKASSAPEKEGGESRWNTASYEIPQGIDRPDLVSYLKEAGIDVDKYKFTKDLLRGQTYDPILGVVKGFDKETGRWGYIKRVSEEEQSSYEKVQKAIDGYMELPQVIAFEEQQQRLKEAGLIDETYFDEETGERLKTAPGSSWAGAAQIAEQLGKSVTERSTTLASNATDMKLEELKQRKAEAEKRRADDWAKQLTNNGVKLNRGILEKSMAYRNLRINLTNDLGNFFKDITEHNKLMGDAAKSDDPYLYMKNYVTKKYIEDPENPIYIDAYNKLQEQERELALAETSGDATFYYELRNNNPNMSEADALKAAVTYTKALRDTNNRHGNTMPMELEGSDKKFTVAEINAKRWQDGNLPRIGYMAYNPESGKLEKTTKDNQNNLRAIVGAEYEKNSATPITIPSANTREQASNNIVKLTTIDGIVIEQFAYASHNLESFGSTFVQYDPYSTPDTESIINYDKADYNAKEAEEASKKKKEEVEAERKSGMGREAANAYSQAAALARLSASPKEKEKRAKDAIDIQWKAHSEKYKLDNRYKAQYTKDLLDINQDLKDMYYAVSDQQQEHWKERLAKLQEKTNLK